MRIKRNLRGIRGIYEYQEFFRSLLILQAIHQKTCFCTVLNDRSKGLMPQRGRPFLRFYTIVARIIYAKVGFLQNFYTWRR